ncbi:MAG: endonuclease/exonuclease/phosphatase family protein [Lentisphaeraceae bacterium]|nr:endonuclease/exonuclease/phosphatase family protein [Lentisphaeraceae bacterium]
MKSVLVLMLFLICSCATKAPHEVDVMTFNIRYGTAKDGDNHWSKRKQLVFDLINKYNADAVGLQEALDFQIGEIIEHCPQYAYFGTGRERNLKGEYTAILYKKDKFSIHEAETFWLSDTPQKPSTSWGNKLLRTATSARLVNRQSGDSFYIYNTHFDHRSQESREMAAKFLKKRIQQRPFPAPYIFMGDFNSIPDSPQIKHLLAKSDSLSSMIDVHAEGNPQNVGEGTFSHFVYGQFGRKIDYIFAEKGTLKVLESQVIRDSKNERYPSDHFPVYGRVIFESQK